LDVSSKEALSRIEKRENKNFSDADEKRSENDVQSKLGGYAGEGRNIFENLSFQEEVVARYPRLVRNLDEDIEVVDASPSIEEVFNSVLDAVETVGF
ncbi:MAG: hypothetical protein ABEJ72_04220, partial [Candidatus Aenigmatarchaeota archaeon]